MASDSSDSEMEQCSSPDLKETPTEAVLPQRSKARYEKTYKIFKDWCATETMSNADIESVILAYFSDLGKSKKPTTLWATYSMLRTTLIVKENIDITKFAKVGAYLKKLSAGYRPKKSNIFTQSDIDKFLKEAPLEFLPQKVALIIGVSGACRSDELFRMKITDIKFLKNKVSITIPNAKNDESETCTITNVEWMNILKKYIDLRQNIDSDRLFMQLRHGKITRQAFGHNTVAMFPRKIATYLKLEDSNTFTGHCFRRTATALLINSEDDNLHSKKLGGLRPHVLARMLSTSMQNSFASSASTSSQQSMISNEQPVKPFEIEFLPHFDPDAEKTETESQLREIKHEVNTEDYETFSQASFGPQYVKTEPLPEDPGCSSYTDTVLSSSEAKSSLTIKTECDDSEFDIEGRQYAEDLKSLLPEQRILVRKFVANIMSRAKMNLLTLDYLQEF